MSALRRSTAVATSSRWSATRASNVGAQPVAHPASRSGALPSSTVIRSHAAVPVVVAEDAVHHRHGVRRAGEVRGHRPPGLLPADVEALAVADDVVEVAGQSVDLEPPRERQVLLVVEEGQPGLRVGVVAAGCEVAGGDVDFGGHQVEVEVLEATARIDIETLDHPPGVGD